METSHGPTPAASTRTRTSSGPGCGISVSVSRITSGPPGSLTMIACIVSPARLVYGRSMPLSALQHTPNGWIHRARPGSFPQSPGRYRRDAAADENALHIARPASGLYQQPARPAGEPSLMQDELPVHLGAAGAREVRANGARRTARGDILGAAVVGPVPSFHSVRVEQIGVLGADRGEPAAEVGGRDRGPRERRCRDRDHDVGQARRHHGRRQARYKVGGAEADAAENRGGSRRRQLRAELGPSLVEGRAERGAATSGPGGHGLGRQLDDPVPRSAAAGPVVKHRRGAEYRVPGEVEFLHQVEDPRAPPVLRRCRREKDALEMPELPRDGEHLPGRGRAGIGDEHRQAVARERPLGKDVDVLVVHVSNYQPAAQGWAVHLAVKWTYDRGRL